MALPKDLAAFTLLSPQSTVRSVYTGWGGGRGRQHRIGAGFEAVCLHGVWWWGEGQPAPDWGRTRGLGGTLPD